MRPGASLVRALLLQVLGSSSLLGCSGANELSSTLAREAEAALAAEAAAASEESGDALAWSGWIADIRVNPPADAGTGGWRQERRAAEEPLDVYDHGMEALSTLSTLGARGPAAKRLRRAFFACRSLRVLVVLSCQCQPQ